MNVFGHGVHAQVYVFVLRVVNPDPTQQHREPDSQRALSTSDKLTFLFPALILLPTAPILLGRGARIAGSFIRHAFAVNRNGFGRSANSLASTFLYTSARIEWSIRFRPSSTAIREARRNNFIT